MCWRGCTRASNQASFVTFTSIRAPARTSARARSGRMSSKQTSGDSGTSPRPARKTTLSFPAVMLAGQPQATCQAAGTSSASGMNSPPITRWRLSYSPTIRPSTSNRNALLKYSGSPDSRTAVSSDPVRIGVPLVHRLQTSA